MKLQKRLVGVLVVTPVLGFGLFVLAGKAQPSRSGLIANFSANASDTAPFHKNQVMDYGFLVKNPTSETILLRSVSFPSRLNPHLRLIRTSASRGIGSTLVSGWPPGKTPRHEVYPINKYRVFSGYYAAIIMSFRADRAGIYGIGPRIDVHTYRTGFWSTIPFVGRLQLAHANAGRAQFCVDAPQWECDVAWSLKRVPRFGSVYLDLTGHGGYRSPVLRFPKGWAATSVSTCQSPHHQGFAVRVELPDGKPPPKWNIWTLGIGRAKGFENGPVRLHIRTTSPCNWRIRVYSGIVPDVLPAPLPPRKRLTRVDLRRNPPLATLDGQNSLATHF